MGPGLFGLPAVPSSVKATTSVVGAFPAYVTPGEFLGLSTAFYPCPTA